MWPNQQRIDITVFHPYLVVWDSENSTENNKTQLKEKTSTPKKKNCRSKSLYSRVLCDYDISVFNVFAMISVWLNDFDNEDEETINEEENNSEDFAEDSETAV